MKLPRIANEKPPFRHLDATLDGLLRRRGEQDVQVIGHDHEAVQQITAFIAIVEEEFDHLFGVSRALKDAKTVVGDGCDSVRLRIGAHASGVNTSGAKARFCAGSECAG
ncbi:MAG: hypothetical protein P4L10_09530 [Acidobacteriaceae bacterium]|nr:hypothetical protein [Acidobacteriaceae bacterium]